MEAWNDFKGFAGAADAVVSRDRRSSIGGRRGETAREMHNARGLIVAVLLSAACWAVLGFALLT